MINTTVFDKEWFIIHQQKLLLFSNTWFGRKVFCIDKRKSFVGENKIIGILPNAIFWKTGKNKYAAEFRVHDKFGKRLYYNFKPFWQIAHFWDETFAGNFQPAWDLGFNTLTAYPASGEVSPVDGIVARQTVDEAFTTIRAGAGAYVDDATNAPVNAAYLKASTTSNQFASLVRGIWCFDTSSIGSGSTISAATFSLWGRGKGNGLGSPDAHVVGSTPASTSILATSDYGQVQFTTFGNVTYANWSGTDTVYNDFTLNANGISNISLTGISKFGSVMSWDLNNSFGGSWVSGASSTLDTYQADQPGTTNDPKLFVTYTPAGGGVTISAFKTLLGTGQA